MTAQMGEIIFIDGEEKRMQFCPPLPPNSPHVKRNPKPETVSTSTGCWRGYVGIWEIANNNFYLKGIKAPHGNGKGMFIFSAPSPLLADWFSGVLRLPRGKMLRYVHMGFGSTFEEEDHIKIVDGVVVGRRRVSNVNEDGTPRVRTRHNLPGGENLFDGDDW